VSFTPFFFFQKVDYFCCACVAIVVSLLGNDCLFEYNTISGLCYEATDTGAFYTGRNWIDRGNIIRHSTFENIRMTEKTVLGAMSVQAIYLDDQV